MTPNTNRDSTALREVMYRFASEATVPNAELLEAYVRRYPAFAEELTDLAVELALHHENDAGDEGSPAAAQEATPPAVSRAMSRLQNRLHANRLQATADRAEQTAEVTNPFAPLERAQFRKLVEALGIDGTLLVKLRDRQIIASTIPAAFMRRLADGLGTSVDAVTRFLAVPPFPGSAQQFYKADDKPQIGQQQSFQDAVATARISEHQRRELLKP